MSNIFTGQDIYYISVQEVKDTSKKNTILSLTDNEIKELIVNAEKIIDNYLGYSFGAKISEQSNTTIFDIKIATFYIVEQIHENGDFSSSKKSNGFISSESSGDRSISFQNTKDSQYASLGIPEISKMILDKYKKIFFKQVL